MQRTPLNLVLIGMPGSGKSSVGQLVATKLGWDFYDTDLVVMQQAGRTVAEIFRDCGEIGFRQQETAAICECSKREYAVIATGGGAVTREENMRLLRATGALIYLNRPLELILNSDLTDRPLLSADPHKLTELFTVRQPLYERYAQYTVMNIDTPAAAAAQIVALYSRLNVE